MMCDVEWCATWGICMYVCVGGGGWGVGWGSVGCVWNVYWPVT